MLTEPPFLLAPANENQMLMLSPVPKSILMLGWKADLSSSRSKPRQRYLLTQTASSVKSSPSLSLHKEICGDGSVVFSGVGSGVGTSAAVMTGFSARASAACCLANFFLTDLLGQLFHFIEKLFVIGFKFSRFLQDSVFLFEHRVILFFEFFVFLGQFGCLGL